MPRLEMGLKSVTNKQQRPYFYGVKLSCSVLQEFVIAKLHYFLSDCYS